jgi:acyl carrier protein
MSQPDVVGMFSQFAHKIESHRKFPTITRESKISDLDLDSVAMMEIVGEVEDELDIKIPDEKLGQLATVGDIERVVLEQLAP